MIPVFEPVIGKEEIKAVVDALKKGEISGTYGKYIPEFEQKFAEYCGCKYGVAVTSGTTALHLAVSAAGIKKGDEVLISSSTNIATALAAVYNGAMPVPVDSKPLTWNMNVDLIESLITSKTRAIIPVHLYGHPVDMHKLIKIAKKYNLLVIEDCAESHGATYGGKKTGSFGDMGCFSFYASKIITTGEGGMVVTNSKTLAQKLRLLKNLAFAKPRFLHKQIGFNFRMTGFQAAMGLAQLKKIEKIIAKKRRIAKIYSKYLKKIRGIQLPHEADWARNVYWMYAITINREFGINRDMLMKKLAKDGIETRTFFCPMNQQPCLQTLEGFRKIPCPVADEIWKTGLYLPSSTTLTKKQIQFICEKIYEANNS